MLEQEHVLFLLKITCSTAPKQGREEMVLCRPQAAIGAALHCLWRDPAPQETHAASQALRVTCAHQKPRSAEQSGEAQFPCGRLITASQTSVVLWTTEQSLSFHGSVAILSQLIAGLDQDLKACGTAQKQQVLE